MSNAVSVAESLSRREQQVAEAYASGLNYRDIASQFGIAPATVRTHIGAIYRKLGVTSKVALVRALAARSDDQKSGGIAANGESPALPRPRDPLLGRSSALSDLRALLNDNNLGLVTLTGPGGSGKTRLSLELASELMAIDGRHVHFIELADIRDPNLMTTKVAQKLGASLSGRRSAVNDLAAFLRDSPTLLVLDNFEQILTAANSIAELLAECPNLTILVTSRAPLQVRGEVEYPVLPLALPPEEGWVDIDELRAVPAAALFEARVAAVQPGFRIDPENADTVAEICRQLDGLPLALELAAARMRLLDTESLRDRLDHRLPLLTRGGRDLPERQKTLRSTIAWSYDLLAKGEKKLFEALSVFIGGFDMESLVSVCSESSANESNLEDDLEALLMASLVQRVEGPNGMIRFQLLETLREYAQEQLDCSSRRDDLLRRHAAYFANLAEIADPKLAGPDQLLWLERLESDHANFRSALAWSLGTEGDPVVGMRITAHLCWFWRMRGYIGEADSWVRSVLAACPEKTPERARALWGLVMMIAGHQEDRVRALTYADEALSVARGVSNEETAWALHALGRVHHASEDMDEAYSAFSESFELFKRIGNMAGCAYSGWKLGSVARDSGDSTQAKSAIDEALIYARRSGDQWALASCILQAGGLELSLKNYADAATHLKESLRLFHTIGARWGMWYAVVRLATSFYMQGYVLRATKLSGFEHALRIATGTDGDATELRYSVSTEQMRRDLGDERFNEAFVMGQAMTLEGAVFYVQSQEDLEQ